MHAELITVHLKSIQDGWIVATSPDLPGLFLTEASEARVLAELPDAIALLYRTTFHREVRVLPASVPSSATHALAVPTFVAFAA